MADEGSSDSSGAESAPVRPEDLRPGASTWDVAPALLPAGAIAISGSSTSASDVGGSLSAQAGGSGSSHSSTTAAGAAEEGKD